MLRLLSVTIAVLLVTMPHSLADETRPNWQQLELGFGGAGRAGVCLPITAAVESLQAGQSYALELTAPDPVGDLVRVRLPEVTADASGAAEFTGLLRCGRIEGTISLDLYSSTRSDQPIDRRVIEIDFTEDGNRIHNRGEDGILTLAASGLTSPLRLVTNKAMTVLAPQALPGLGEMVVQRQSETGRADRVIQFTAGSERQFPISPFGYESVDHVVLGGDFTILNPSQVDALKDWVRGGGSLFLSCGQNLTELRQSALAPWLSPLLELNTEPDQIRDVSSVQNHVQGSVPVQTNRRAVYRAGCGTGRGAKILIDSSSGPLAIRIGDGAGTITYVAVDLTDRPFSNWASLSAFYESMLFGRGLSAGSKTVRQSANIAQSGMTDLGTQLDAAADAVPPEERWNSWNILGILGGLVLLLGPLDYLLVVVLLKRPALTWVTFPASVSIVTVLLAFASGSRHGDDGLTLRAVTIRDYAITSDRTLVSEESRISLASASARRLSLGMPPADASAASLFSWHGRYEDVFGGIYRAGGAGVGRLTYGSAWQLGRPEIAQMPLLAGGSRACSLRSRSYSSSPVDAELAATGSGVLQGWLVSPLDAPLQDWLMAYGNRVYLPNASATEEQATLEPGERWESGTSWMRTMDLRSYLTARRIVVEGDPEDRKISDRSMTVSTPYDLSGRDPLQILQTATFYDALGGAEYTQLSNDSLRHWDLSDSIRLNYAVLIGRLRESGVTCMIDGAERPADSSDTVVRLVLPVRREEGVE